MTTPQFTPVDAFERYVGEKCLVASQRKALREIEARIITQITVVGLVTPLAVSEPFLARTNSREAEFRESEGKGFWTSHRTRRAGRRNSWGDVTEGRCYNRATTMTTWSQIERAGISASDCLPIALSREDGFTHGTPSWVRSVAVEGGLNIRPCKGRKSTWCQKALRPRRRKIGAAGLTKEVAFEAGGGPDRRKYVWNGCLEPMNGEKARSSTHRIRPE
jgi:hypothetical protein